uniref:ATP-dependent DNA helicase n=1 Tax=Loa loa TaxID=7209 RepID=A0A1I7VYW4_LOALO
MPSPNRFAAASFNVELRHKQNYNTEKRIYDLITVNNGVGEIFLDAPGGTGKISLIRLILGTIRPENDIALFPAFSGIASTLLQGGRIAHSALKFPLVMRQTLPVIPRSTPADEINACLKYCIWWRHIKALKLTTNMHVQLQNNRLAEIFSHQLLETGDEEMPKR